MWESLIPLLSIISSVAAVIAAGASTSKLSKKLKDITAEEILVQENSERLIQELQELARTSKESYIDGQFDEHELMFIKNRLSELIDEAQKISESQR